VGETSGCGVKGEEKAFFAKPELGGRGFALRSQRGGFWMGARVKIGCGGGESEAISSAYKE
jgi:hypothetical protein